MLDRGKDGPLCVAPKVHHDGPLRFVTPPHADAKAVRSHAVGGEIEGLVGVLRAEPKHRGTESPDVLPGTGVVNVAHCNKCILPDCEIVAPLVGGAHHLSKRRGLATRSPDGARQRPVLCPATGSSAAGVTSDRCVRWRATRNSATYSASKRGQQTEKVCGRAKPSRGPRSRVGNICSLASRPESP